MPLIAPDDQRLPDEIKLLDRLVREQGRDVTQMGLEGRIAATATESLDDWRRTAEAWRHLGATYVTVTYEGGRFTDLDQFTDRTRGLMELPEFSDRTP